MRPEDDICCEENVVHESALEAARKLLPDEVELCDLAELLKVSQSAISHQLALLRASKLVKYRRDGKTVFYSLDDDHIFSILAQGMEHIKEG